MMYNIKALVIGLVGVFLMSISPALMAQKEMTLEDCLAYADSNSIEIQRAKVSLQSSELSWHSAKSAFLPSINASMGQSWSFGQSTNYDNVKVQNNISNTSAGISANVPLFSGFSKSYALKAAKIDVKASEASVENYREALYLQIMGAYLDVLYNNSLVQINQEQMALSAEMVIKTRDMVDAGKVAPSDYVDQLATASADSATYTESVNTYQLSLLQLSQLINFPNLEDFAIADINADAVMQQGENTLPAPQSMQDDIVLKRPSVESALYSLESARIGVKKAKSGYYPTLSGNLGWSTNYYYNYTTEAGYINPKFSDQIDDNASRYIGLSLNIPIFNQFSTRDAVKSADLSVVNAQLAVLDAKQTAYKDIQTAYYNAIAAHKQYISAQSSLKSAKLAYDYAQAKVMEGRMSIYDFSQAKTRWQKAASQSQQAKYSYVFRTKIFLFYQQVDR